MEHEWPRISELARAPRIAHNRTCELVGPGEMPSMRIGYSVRVGRSELDRWLEEQPAECEVKIPGKLNDCFMVSVVAGEWERSSRLRP